MFCPVLPTIRKTKAYENYVLSSATHYPKD